MAITVSKVFEAKPKAGSLKPGEVGQYKDAKGKTLYVIGTVSGGMTQATSSLKNAEAKYSKVLKSAENAQLTNLREENKIEIIELQRTLKEKGMTQAEINAAVKMEQRNNDAEVTAAKTLLNAAGYQTLSRNSTTNTLTAFNATDTAKGVNIPTSFNVSAVTNPDGSKTYKWNSLAYNGAGADDARNTIASTLDQVNRLKVSYGLLNDVYTYTGGGDSQSTTGVSNAALYGALRDGYIKFNNETNDFYVDYAGDQVNKGRDENGFGWTSQQLRKIGGKGFERGVQNILNRGTSIGDKAFTTTKNGQTYITTADGKTIKGSPLKDSGEVDASGNKIFTQVSNMDTKYNKATTANVYVQNADGTFTYMGTPDVAYTHIEKKDGGFSLGGFIAKALITTAASYFGTPFLGKIVGEYFGLSDVAANAVASALIGGGISAASGGNIGDIVTDAALAGMGSAVGDVLSKAANYYGGWTGLATELVNNPDDVLEGMKNIATASAASGTGVKLAYDSAGRIVDAVTNAAVTGPGIPNITSGTSMADLTPGVNITSGTGGLMGSGALAGGVTDETLGGLITSTPNAGSVTAGDILDAQMPDLAATTNAVDFNVTSGVYAPPPLIDLGLNARGQYSSPGINLALDQNGNIIDANTGLPFTGQGVNLYNAATGTYVQPPSTTGFGTGGTTTGGSTGGTGSSGSSLIDDAVSAVKNNPLTTAATIAGVTLVPAVVNNIQDLLNPTQDVPNYPAADLYGVGTDYAGLGNPNWFNNLFERQGYGAGQYLGYDILNGLGLPEDVLGLLGGSVGQNTRSSLIA